MLEAPTDFIGLPDISMENLARYIIRASFS